jgi:hypothetical protein
MTVATTTDIIYVCAEILNVTTSPMLESRRVKSVSAQNTNNKKNVRPRLRTSLSCHNRCSNIQHDYSTINKPTLSGTCHSAFKFAESTKITAFAAVTVCEKCRGISVLSAGCHRQASHKLLNILTHWKSRERELEKISG